MDLFLGRSSGHNLATDGTAVEPACQQIQLRLMTVFNKSITAANAFPNALKVRLLLCQGPKHWA